MNLVTDQFSYFRKKSLYDFTQQRILYIFTCFSLTSCRGKAAALLLLLLTASFSRTRYPPDGLNILKAVADSASSCRLDDRTNLRSCSWSRLSCVSLRFARRATSHGHSSESEDSSEERGGRGSMTGLQSRQSMGRVCGGGTDWDFLGGAAVDFVDPWLVLKIIKLFIHVVVVNHVSKIGHW